MMTLFLPRTRIAMKGSMSFHEALRKRLELIKPSKELMINFLKRNPPRLTPGIA